MLRAGPQGMAALPHIGPGKIGCCRLFFSFSLSRLFFSLSPLPSLTFLTQARSFWVTFCLVTSLIDPCNRNWTQLVNISIHPNTLSSCPSIILFHETSGWSPDRPADKEPSELCLIVYCCLDVFTGHLKIGNYPTKDLRGSSCHSSLNVRNGSSSISKYANTREKQKSNALVCTPDSGLVL
ncbi:hypothetical protein BX600DRAFT_285476 [Xylariales sp. PMI_506]|nr:hypothetical protein BX600DRAFT_285476 [Xylariales sp. PMI_506]